MDYVDHFKKNIGDFAFWLSILFIFRQLINPEKYTMDGLLLFACFSILFCAFIALMIYSGRWPIWKSQDFED